MNTTSRPGSPAGLRDANRRRVLDAVRGAGAPTQAEIAGVTGLAPATVSNIVRDLAAAGRVEAGDEVRGGRRVRAVRLVRRAGVVAGIDVGHRHVRVALADVADPAGAVDHAAPPERVEVRADLPDDHGVADGLDTASRLLDEVLARTGARRAALRGAVVGLPAPLDLATGAVGASGVLPGWVGVPVAGRVAEHLGVPSWVDNDATLGTLAEQRWGALRGVDDGLFLKLSDGVGAGLVLGGRLYRGPDGTAGEIGHVAVAPGDRFAAVCRCGHRGCLETLVSTRTVTAMLEPLLGAPLTIADVVARAHDGSSGSAPARRVLADTGHHVGVALAGLCTVLTPRRIVVGGELAQAGPLLLAPLHAALEAAAVPGTVRTAEVVTADLAEHAPVLGALALALERCALAP
ncbi:ROK family transcriptional regulator [Actinomycetospora cinnamomea]|uniref:MarR family transcriptional regulator n=1 Tax=Actinomycetospora cinnamomea TaxID=663609 RepID=A0A2U1EBG7_9PSEU|nr:ROK family transcriptional regulator [Actinomycetospora cinnamomea]PVY97298.1 MarR family transcriptional regulator [Actinomycetospora cinnamomea]